MNLSLQELVDKYEKDNPQPVGASNSKTERQRKNRLTRAMKRATVLQSVSLDGLTREQAEKALNDKLASIATQKVQKEEACGAVPAIFIFVLKAIASWLIGKILEAKYGK